MSASDEIHSRVARVLAESLGADDDAISPKTMLVGDLGAESIDFLDIVFRLEREFRIEIPRDELFPESVLSGMGDIAKDGIVTDHGLALLRSRMPYADFGAFDQNRRLSAVADLFTVELLERYVEWKLGQRVLAG